MPLTPTFGAIQARFGRLKFAFLLSPAAARPWNRLWPYAKSRWNVSGPATSKQPIHAELLHRSLYFRRRHRHDAHPADQKRCSRGPRLDRRGLVVSDLPRGAFLLFVRFVRARGGADARGVSSQLTF